MMRSTMHSDYIVFLDVHSSEIFSRDENNNSVIVAIDRSYDHAVDLVHTDKQLTLYLKTALRHIQSHWKKASAPTVSLVLSDAYMHTVFNECTYVFPAEKIITKRVLSRLLLSDMRTRSLDAVFKDITMPKDAYGYADYELFYLAINGYEVPFESVEKIEAREVMIMYGAALCSRKLYNSIQDMCSRAHVRLTTVTSLTLAVMRSYPHVATAHTVCVVQDTVSSLYFIEGAKVTSFLIPVGFFNTITTSDDRDGHRYREQLFLDAVHGLAKRYSSGIEKRFSVQVKDIFLPYNMHALSRSQMHVSQKLTVCVPFVCEKNKIMQSAVQSLLFPNAHQYTVLRESSHLLSKHAIIAQS